MKIFAPLIFVLSFLASPLVWAGEACPGIDSPEATAIKYKLFTAYQTGFDGYEAPCELKCFGKENCQNKCQSKEGLRLLQEKLHEISQSSSSKQCPSYTLGCLEQCKKLGVSCAAVCGRDLPVAQTDMNSN